jgi:hypothetical protein
MSAEYTPPLPPLSTKFVIVDDDDDTGLWLPDLEKFHAKLWALEIAFIRDALPTESASDRIMLLAIHAYGHAHALQQLANDERASRTWNGL